MGLHSDLHTKELITSEDTELVALAETCEKAQRTLEKHKTRLDDAVERLDSRRRKHDPRIDRLARKGNKLHRQMGDAFARSQECYRLEDHEGAGDWSQQGKALEAQLDEINGKKNKRIAKLKTAQAKLDKARGGYLSAKAAHEAAQRAFNERRGYVKQQERQREEARSRRRAAKVADPANEAVRAAIEGSKRFVQFLDDDIRVSVQQGYDGAFETSVINVFIDHRNPAIREHVHAIFREDTGEELMCEYHPDKKS